MKPAKPHRLDDRQLDIDHERALKQIVPCAYELLQVDCRYACPIDEQLFKLLDDAYKTDQIDTTGIVWTELIV